MIWLAVLLGWISVEPETIESDVMRELVLAERRVVEEGAYNAYGDGNTVEVLQWARSALLTLGPDHEFVWDVKCPPTMRRRGRRVVKGPEITTSVTARTRGPKAIDVAIERFDGLRDRLKRLGETASILMWVGLDEELVIHPGDYVICVLETTCERTLRTQEIPDGTR